MDRKRILIIDDEQDLCEILDFNLSAAGYATDTAGSAEAALQRDLPAYDLLLLDVMMPGMSGFELAEHLNQDPRTAGIPIIFLTARDTEDDMLQGFGLGADDYIKKPFSVREVTARVKAVLSRTQSATHPEAPDSEARQQLLFEGIAIDLNKKKMTIDGQEVALTKTELELLSTLLRHRGQVLSRQALLESAWPEGVIVTDRAVDVNITRLRKKIGSYGQYIIARQGYGYVFEDNTRQV